MTSAIQFEVTSHAKTPAQHFRRFISLRRVVGLLWAGGRGPRIVQKSIDAIWREAKLAKYKRANVHGKKGLIYGMATGAVHGRYAVSMARPVSHLEILGAFVIVLNGDKGWVKSADGSVKDMTPEQLPHKCTSQAGWMSFPCANQDKAFALKNMPSKSRRRPARVLLASRKDYPVVTLYFDKADHLLVKIGVQTKAAEENYKEVPPITSSANSRKSKA